MTEQPGPPEQQPHPPPYPQGANPPGGRYPPAQYPPQPYPQVPYGHPGYVQPGYPPPGYVQQPYGQPMMQPMQVHQVGMAVTKPAWTMGQILAVIFTCGFAWPIIWLSRRSKTTITRHR